VVGRSSATASGPEGWAPSSRHGRGCAECIGRAPQGWPPLRAGCARDTESAQSGRLANETMAAWDRNVSDRLIARWSPPTMRRASASWSSAWGRRSIASAPANSTPSTSTRSFTTVVRRHRLPELGEHLQPLECQEALLAATRGGARAPQRDDVGRPAPGRGRTLRSSAAPPTRTSATGRASRWSTRPSSAAARRGRRGEAPYSDKPMSARASARSG
jgi:hypothetical protein